MLGDAQRMRDIVSKAPRFDEEDLEVGASNLEAGTRDSSIDEAGRNGMGTVRLAEPRG